MAGPTRHRALPAGRLSLLALLFALLAGGAIAAQIAWRGEIWHERTYWVVTLAAFGGFFAAFSAHFAACVAGFLLPRFPAPIAAALLFAGAFMVFMGFGYVAYQLGISGDYELNPDRPLRGLLVAFAQVFAVFLVMSPTYLLPLPLPVLMLAAAFLLAPAHRKVEPEERNV